MIYGLLLVLFITFLPQGIPRETMTLRGATRAQRARHTRLPKGVVLFFTSCARKMYMQALRSKR